MSTAATAYALDARTHYNKYEELADQLGVYALMRLVPENPLRLRQLYAHRDVYFMQSKLAWWQAQHLRVYGLAARAGVHDWTQDDTVCVLKHVARWYSQYVAVPEDNNATTHVVITAHAENCYYIQSFIERLAALNYQRHVEYRLGMACHIYEVTRINGDRA